MDRLRDRAASAALREAPRAHHHDSRQAHAIRNRRPPRGLIHHSDLGVQYACGDYRKLLEANGITASMSRKGNYLDNAPMESFFGTLKNLVHRTPFRTRRP